jgi:hypothetical protein
LIYSLTRLRTLPGPIPWNRVKCSTNAPGQTAVWHLTQTNTWYSAFKWMSPTKSRGIALALPICVVLMVIAVVLPCRRFVWYLGPGYHTTCASGCVACRTLFGPGYQCVVTRQPSFKSYLVVPAALTGISNSNLCLAIIPFIAVLQIPTCISGCTTLMVYATPPILPNPFINRLYNGLNALILSPINKLPVNLSLYCRQITCNYNIYCALY